MPIRRSPNGAGHTRPQPGRDRPEWVVAINRNARSQSIGIGGRNQPVRPVLAKRTTPHRPNMLTRRHWFYATRALKIPGADWLPQRRLIRKG